MIYGLVFRLRICSGLRRPHSPEEAVDSRTGLLLVTQGDLNLLRRPMRLGAELITDGIHGVHGLGSGGGFPASRGGPPPTCVRPCMPTL